MVLKVMLSPVVKLSHGTLATKCHGEQFGDDFCGLRRQVGRYQQKNRSLHHFTIYQVIVAL